MLFCNDKNFGGDFKKAFIDRLKTANRIIIASGYIGSSLIDELTPKLLQIAATGSCKILVGMIFHSGVSKKLEESIKTFDEELRKTNEDNGVYISRVDYHGKIYWIDDDIYIGSSNFSESGFKTNLECTSRITNPETIQKIKDYVNDLLGRETTAKLSSVELKKKQKHDVIKPSKLLRDYKIEEVPDYEIIGEMQIKLRVDKQPASSLNLYFDRGRKNQNNIYSPRPWYEVEITATKEERENPLYPVSERIDESKNSRSGNFTAFIKEGLEYFKIEMAVYSDFGKAIASSKDSGGRETLGRYIKGKLENAGLLKVGEQITSEILDSYGRDYIRLKKIAEKKYVLEF